MSDTTVSPELVKKTKPVAGVLWGIVFGAGLALLAVNFTIIGLAVVPMVVVLVIGVVLSVLWSIFGPAKQLRGARSEPSPEPGPGSADEVTDA